MAKSASARAKHKADCQMYLTRRIREKNKKRRLLKHLKNNANDSDAQKALKLVA